MLLQIERTEIKELQEKCPDLTFLEAGIVYLNQQQYTYSEIRLKLGNPSNKIIKYALKKYRELNDSKKDI